MKNDSIRKPAVAGLFYPGSAVELVKTIAELFARVRKENINGVPSALIVPHAGYPYSGKTAAKAYKLLEGEKFDTVVVISPSHTVFFKGSSVYDGDGYETPIGVVEIDRKLSDKIGNIHPQVYLSKMGHASGNTRGEHALEVQLPFLQIVLGNFKLVAIVMGDQEEDSINSLAETLSAALKGTNTLLVASTDLSHFHSEKIANRLDEKIKDAIVNYNPEILVDTLESGDGEACGGGIVAAVLKASKRLGSKEVQLLDYTTSGETTGDFDEVVGYLSAVVVREKRIVSQDETIGTSAAAKKTEFVLTDEDKQQLLKIARDAIFAHLHEKKYEPPMIERLEEKRGAFVTIKLHGELRGCIGLIKSRQPLTEAVAEMAVAAAFEDPRFPMITEKEFEKLEYEISVLSPLKRVHDFNDILIGRDGLMLKMDLHSGLLLPQVASENNWDRITFLEQTCLKAGLPKNSYKDKYAELYRFEADVF